MALNQHNTEGAERDPRLDQLYARAGREEPRAELDQAIRAAARREVQARPQALGAGLRRWRLPISIAAVVVLSVSVVTLMREEGADRSEEGLSPTTLEPGAPAAPSYGDAKKKAGKSVTTPSGAQPPAPQALPEPAAELTAPSAKESQRAGRVDAPAVRRTQPAEPFAAEPRQRAADAMKESVSQQSQPAAEAPAKAAAPGAARALRAPAATMQAIPSETEQDTAGKRALEKSERSLSDSQTKALLQELDGAPPAVWLEKIEALRREGKRHEADDLQTEFRRRFPKHPLPVHDSGQGN
jgi:hypothetical protein